jgi:small conductance mechanosensitive channel
MLLGSILSLLESFKLTLLGLLGEKGFEILMNILSGAVGILFYLFIYEIIKKLVNNFFEKVKGTQGKYSLDDRRLVTLNSVSLSVLKYIFYFFIVVTIIGVFGGEISQVTTVVAGVGSVAIGFGSQSLVKDIITGFFLLLENQLAVGDVVSVSGLTGKVETVGIRTTKLRAFNGDLYTIPNGQISIVNNMSREFKRAIVEIGISHGESIEKVIEVLEDEMKNVYEKVSGLQEIPQVLGISSFTDTAMMITITAICDITENARIEREIRKYVKMRFDKETIAMSCTHRTMEIIK